MANLQNYGMFDFADGDTDIYQYTSAEWAEYINSIMPNGIVNNYGDKFAATASGLDITFGSGKCFILGRCGWNTEAEIISLDAESASLQRIDRIVLTVDITSRTLALSVKKGTASSSPTAPEIIQSALLFELPVYQARITSGSTVTLTDERNLVLTYQELLTIANAIIAGEYPNQALYA